MKKARAKPGRPRLSAAERRTRAESAVLGFLANCDPATRQEVRAFCRTVNYSGLADRILEWLGEAKLVKVHAAEGTIYLTARGRARAAKGAEK